MINFNQSHYVHGVSMKKLIVVLYLGFLSTCASAQETADYVIVEKSKHQLSLLKSGKVFATYHVVFGGNPVGHKQQKGDNKTPEGRYILDSKDPNSDFTKAIHISYPNATDIANAEAKNVSPGGGVTIHGQKNGWDWLSFAAQRINWTGGCIALNNSDMEQVYKSINVPTSIEIKP